MAINTSSLEMANTYPEHRHVHTGMANAYPEHKCVQTGAAKSYLEHKNLNSSFAHFFCKNTPPPSADQKCIVSSALLLVFNTVWSGHPSLDFPPPSPADADALECLSSRAPFC